MLKLATLLNRITIPFFNVEFNTLNTDEIQPENLVKWIFLVMGRYMMYFISTISISSL